IGSIGSNISKSLSGASGALNIAGKIGMGAQGLKSISRAVRGHDPLTNGILKGIAASTAVSVSGSLLGSMFDNLAKIMQSKPKPTLIGRAQNLVCDHPIKTVIGSLLLGLMAGSAASKEDDQRPQAV
ncbi:MAG: hypothetical protein AAF621_05385, partial [Pseudomonadota bacterium]